MDGSSSSSTRERLARLAEEFLERLRRGERPTPAEYAGRHPEDAERILDLFPALARGESAGDDGSCARPPSASRTRPDGHPERLGDFLIVRIVGRGGMGVVYEAVQVSLGRRVALKVLPWSSGWGESDLRRFELEARATARLHHTNIVPVYSVGEHDGTHYFAMQFIQGQDLDVIIDELRRLRGRPVVAHVDGPAPTVAAAGPRRDLVRTVAEGLLTGTFVPPEREASTLVDETRTFRPGDPPAEGPALLDGAAYDWQWGDPARAAAPPPPGLSTTGATYFRSVARAVLQVAEALAYAHDQGVLHRDIKPSNLMMDARGTVWVTDFGLAKSEGVDGPTRIGDIVGTLRYMPPERFEGRSDRKSDLYSLGATMYELLTLRPLFDESSRCRLVDRVLHHEPTPPRRIDPEVPRDLEVICLKLLSKEPTGRYESATELAEELRRFLAGEPIRARRSNVLERACRWCRRQPVVAGLLTALAASLLVGFVVSSWQWWRARSKADQARAAEWTAQAQATRANGLARDASEKARSLERQLYINRINLAHRECMNNNVAEADRLLALCPMSLRGWEWAFVKRLCHLERATFSDGAQSVNAVAYSPDGRWLACGDGEPYQSSLGTGAAGLVLRDAATGRVVRRFEGIKGSVSDVAFSPDGRWLAAASGFYRPANEGHVTVWEAATGRLVFDRREERITALCVAFSPDGAIVAAGFGKHTGDEPGLVRLWATADGAERLHFPAPPGGVNSIAFSPDGHRLALACAGVVVLRDLDARGEARELRGHERWVYSLAFTRDGRRLATGGWDGLLRTWDPDTGELLDSLDTRAGPIHSLAFDPDGRRLATGGNDALMLWDLRTQRLVATLRGHAGEVRCVTFRPDGRRIASAGIDRTVKIWDAEAGEPGVFRGQAGWITALAFAPDGRRVASGAGDHTLALWDPATGELLGHRPAHEDWVLALAYHPDGTTLASGGADNAVRTWDAATLRPRGLVAGFGHGEYVRGVAYSPDGTTLAVAIGTRDHGAEQPGRVHLFDVATGKETMVYRGHRGRVLGIAFRPDGKVIATAAGVRGDDPGAAVVKIWEAATGRELATCRGHVGDISGLAFGPDGDVVATAGEDRTVRLWDAATGHLIRLLDGHADGVDCVAFSRDGRRLASGGRDKTIKLWDVTTGDEILTLRGHSAGVIALAFSRDGRRLVSGSIDHTARVWDTTPITPLDDCRRAPERIEFPAPRDEPPQAIAQRPPGRLW
jgi:WD40 repeat protein/serine/threonine protein kinase